MVLTPRLRIGIYNPRKNYRNPLKSCLIVLRTRFKQNIFYERYAGLLPNNALILLRDFRRLIKTRQTSSSRELLFNKIYILTITTCYVESF